MVKVKQMFGEFMEGSKLFGALISAIINSLLLCFVYFVGVGLTSIFARIFGKKFLDKKTDGNCESYWEELNLGVKPRQEYYRQF